jgi:hypothetical protein
MLALGLAVGFGLGAWYGSRRVVGKIRAYVGGEKWDRIKRGVRP